MACREETVRTIDDLKRAVRSIARHFNTDTVFLIDSQAVLASWPDAPALARMSAEIDAYPGNAKDWERRNRRIEASEEINAVFGIGSDFHLAFGFYIDGVDENTATLPPDWSTREVRLEIEDGPKSITAIVPSLNDLIVSKLARLEEKDKSFVRVCHKAKPLNFDEIRQLLETARIEPAIRNAAIGFLDRLPQARP